MVILAAWQYPGVILAAILLTCCLKRCGDRGLPHDHLLLALIVLMLVRPQGLFNFTAVAEDLMADPAPSSAPPRAASAPGA